MVNRFSHSSLDTFRLCPKKFEFHYIIKAEVPRRNYAHFHLGTSVHRQLKIAYDWAAAGKLYTLDDMLAAYRAEWEGDKGRRVVPFHEGWTVEDYMLDGERMLTRYYEKYQPFDQGILTISEKALRFDLPNCSVGFQAVLDRVLRLADNRYEICDYKTSRSMVSGATDKGFRNQMGMYQLAFQTVYPTLSGEEPPEIELVQHYLRQDEQIRYQMRPDELDELEEQFRSEVAEIQFAERTDEWPTKVGGHCRFCDFAALCPAQRHQKMLDGETESGSEITAEQASKLAEEYVELHRQGKEIKAQQDLLKSDLIEAARALGLTRMVADNGHVTVSLKETTALPTKTKDGDKLASLTALIRSWGEDKESPIYVEPFFELSKTTVMNSYKKGQLGEARSKQVEEFLVTSETARVTPSIKKQDDTDR